MLHLLRHAKSSWSEKGLEDVDRPLNKRGKTSCELMADVLSRHKCFPNYVIVSPAKRARSTIKRIAQNSPKVCSEWIVDDRLYTFELKELVAMVNGLGDDVDDVMLVGHNPALTELTNLLSSAELDNLPTCGYVRLKLDVASWKDVKKDCGKLQEKLFPKMFDADADS